MENELKFEKETHIYTVNNKTIPSVSEIVQDVVGLPYIADEWYLQRGNAIHKALALYLQGKLNENSVDERIRQYVENGKKAIKDISLVPTLVEVMLYHKTLNFAGTPDLLSDTILVDYKTNHSGNTPIQLGGYILLLEDNKMNVKKAYEISLEGQTYSLVEYKVSRCKSLFISVLNIYNWKKERR
ncbi:MAG TPA: hypothetical protein PLL89_05415 [bacterium]|nr:hypothetical protein [bacterium]